MAVWRSLSGRLLLLTVLFVMLAEVLIFVPSVARFRADWLQERLDRGQLAALAKLAAGEAALDPDLELELLENAEVFTVVLQRDERRELLLMRPMESPIGASYDLRDAHPLALIRDALLCAIGTDFRYSRVIGRPKLMGGRSVEVVVDETALRAAMMGYGVRIFWLSLVISAITAGLVFLAVNTFLVRPMRRVIDGIVAFRDDPEDAARVIRPSGASGEIGRAEVELAATQAEVQAALRQKTRLAALGEAVAKLNHDLRNLLASAQLLADRLEDSRDPLVARIAPRLIASLDRAIRLCRQTLAFGSAAEPPPERTPVDLERLVSDVADALGLPERIDGAPARLEARMPAGLVAIADADQLHRALLNLTRNALQAIEQARADSAAAAPSSPGLIAIEARRIAGGVEIDVVDDGPGLPEKARRNLFKAFKGSTRRGGSGLGLAIAAELVRGHGGALSLVESTAAGTRFRIALPDVATGPIATGAIDAPHREAAE